MTTWAGLGCAGANVVPPTKSARLRASCHDRNRLLCEGCAGRPVRPPMGAPPEEEEAARAARAPPREGRLRRLPPPPPSRDVMESRTPRRSSLHAPNARRCRRSQRILHPFILHYETGPPSRGPRLRASARTSVAAVLATQREAVAVARQNRAFKRRFHAPKTRRRGAETSPGNAPKTHARGAPNASVRTSIPASSLAAGAAERRHD